MPGALLACWTFLAHAALERCARDDPSEATHQRALDLLREHRPLTDSTDISALRSAPTAELYGQPGACWTYSERALEILVGRDRCDRLALFSDIDPWLDLDTLSHAWNKGTEHYFEILRLIVLGNPQSDGP